MHSRIYKPNKRTHIHTYYIFGNPLKRNEIGQKRRIYLIWRDNVDWSASKAKVILVLFKQWLAGEKFKQRNVGIEAEAKTILYPWKLFKYYKWFEVNGRKVSAYVFKIKIAIFRKSKSLNVPQKFEQPEKSWSVLYVGHRNYKGRQNWSILKFILLLQWFVKE